MSFGVDMSQHTVIHKLDLDDFMSELLDIPVGTANFNERVEALKQKYQIN